MRIVYFLPDVDGGVARIVKALLKYRPQNKDEYVVVVYSSIENKSSHPIGDFEGFAEVVHFLYSSKENLYAVYRRLANVFRSEHDIMVAHDGWEIRMVAALKLKNPIAYILHGDFKYYYQVCEWNQGIIDLFIAYSNKVFKELTGGRLENGNTNRVKKIYYPATLLEREPSVSARDSFPFKILFAGSLEERKGAHLLKELYDVLGVLIDKFQLHIVGDGNLRQVLAEQFAGCDNVIMEGWKPNGYVIQKMREAHIFLFPSFSEGLPNVVIEALHSGAVPVASDLESGVADIIDENVNGLLVEAGDVKGYANAIVQLYHDRKKLDTLRKNGEDKLEKFEPYRQAALYDEAIRQVSIRSVKKDYPNNPMGKWLNKPWLPNTLVKAVRSIISHPKI